MSLFVRARDVLEKAGLPCNKKQVDWLEGLATEKKIPALLVPTHHKTLVYFDLEAAVAALRSLASNGPLYVVHVNVPQRGDDPKPLPQTEFHSESCDGA